MAYNYINYRYFYVRFDEESRTFEIGTEKQGAILRNISFVSHTRDLNHVYQPVKPCDFAHTECAHEKHLDSNGLSVCFSGGPECLRFMTVRVILSNHGAKFSVEAENDLEYLYDIYGDAVLGETPETDTFAVYSSYTRPGLRCAIGPAAARGCDSLLDRKTDTLLTLGGYPAYRFNYDKNSYDFCVRLTSEVRGFDITVKEGYMTEKFALRYKPMNNNTVFKRPPVGWMTWYAVMFGACEKAVLENSEIQKEKLAAYGADAIWVDWEWYHDGKQDGTADCDTFHPDPAKYPNGLKYVADKIREDGFKPCIWIGASHDVRENEFIKKHPESILLKRKSWCGDYWFDPTSPAYLNEFIPSVFNMLTKDWGYEAIKWDALPRALDYYDQYHDDFTDRTRTAEQAMRDVVRKARETVGDDVYMLSCHGEGSRDLTLYADVFDAARIGADIFSWDNFMESGVGRIFKFYPMHNIIQYCDPDNLVIREQFNTMDQAISRASLFSLIGTPITLGDDLRQLPDDRIEIIRRAIPPMNVHPMVTDSRLRDTETLVVGNYVRTRLDEYIIADVFNLVERPSERELLFTELDLEPEKEYLVYDYWNKEFLGKLRHGVKLSLRPCQSKVLVIREVSKHLQFISSSRHITQGAFDLEKLEWNEETGTLSGTSKTVCGEPYTVTAYDPAKDEIKTVTVNPTSTETDWEIR